MTTFMVCSVHNQEVESGEDANILYSVAAMQGWRTEMVRHVLCGYHSWVASDWYGSLAYEFYLSSWACFME